MLSNFINERGNSVKNQFIVSDADGVTFISYRTTIATIEYNGNVRVNRNCCDYSITTSKYLYQFLRRNGWRIDCKKDVLKLIANGTFKTF